MQDIFFTRCSLLVHPLAHCFLKPTAIQQEGTEDTSPKDQVPLSPSGGTLRRGKFLTIFCSHLAKILIAAVSAHSSQANRRSQLCFLRCPALFSLNSLSPPSVPFTLSPSFSLSLSYMLNRTRRLVSAPHGDPPLFEASAPFIRFPAKERNTLYYSFSLHVSVSLLWIF